jgi:hypothetical protein
VCQRHLKFTSFRSTGHAQASYQAMLGLQHRTHRTKLPSEKSSTAWYEDSRCAHRYAAVERTLQIHATARCIRTQIEQPYLRSYCTRHVCRIFTPVSDVEAQNRDIDLAATTHTTLQLSPDYQAEMVARLLLAPVTALL